MLRSCVPACLGLVLCLPAFAQETGHEHHIDAQTGPHASHSMAGMYGPYPMTREASGTSWQPDSSPMAGLHGNLGEWRTMLHGFATTVFDDQGGPRGDSKTFTASMLMFMAQREAAGGTLGLRSMVSLDPLMGRGGYPLLFQTGETANGADPLVDRQHPHDLFMELAGTYSLPLDDDSSVFVYAGPVGEPALGPAAFMHRFSGTANPEAPLSHHWLDATHITFGVVTIGATWKNWKIEASGFHGREPDEQRWNFDTGRLDSASARLTWNPTRHWSLQVSHGRIESPEQLEPDVDIRRTTASASYDADVSLGHWQTTFAWGRNEKNPGGETDGYLLESALRIERVHTVFARAEHVGKDELFDHGDPRHGQVFDVDKLSVGYQYDFYRRGPATFGIGGLVSGYRYPSALDAAYGSDPVSYMVFVQARIE